jgi:hypothetical protein
MIFLVYACLPVCLISSYLSYPDLILSACLSGRVCPLLSPKTKTVEAELD